jgi:hypothetical protein
MKWNEWAPPKEPSGMPFLALLIIYTKTGGCCFLEVHCFLFPQRELTSTEEWARGFSKDKIFHD